MLNGVKSKRSLILIVCWETNNTKSGECAKYILCFTLKLKIPSIGFVPVKWLVMQNSSDDKRLVD